MTVRRDSSPMRVTVVGRGSAAARTVRILREIGISDILNVASRPLEGCEQNHVTSVHGVSQENSDWVFDCAPASTRLDHARIFSRNGLPTIFEKPLAVSSDEGRKVLDLYLQRGVPMKVGYNLRKLRAFDYVRGILRDRTLGAIKCAELSVGQYLPDWRPGRDYRSTVSAQSAFSGGGVLLELSHEINYAIGLWGTVRSMTGQTSFSSELEIDAEDQAEGRLSFGSGEGAQEVSIELDFLRRTPERWCHIVGRDGALRWNLISNDVTVESTRGSTVRHFDDSLLDTYARDIHEMMDKVPTSRDFAESNADALHTLEVIDAWRLSAETGRDIDVAGLVTHA